MTERATQIEIPGVVWSAGAPEPFVVSTEQRTYLAFYHPDGAPTDGEGDEVTVTELVGCTSFKFGFPSDEVLNGHPLYGRGLNYYRLHAVEDSAWLRELRAIEAVHPKAPAKPFENSRHFVLIFHDTTLEAVATDLKVIGTYHSRADAMTAMTALAGLA